MEHLWNKVAAEFGVTPQEVRLEIQNAISIAMHSGNAQAQKHFAAIYGRGMEPTPEEVVRYLCMLAMQQIS